MKSSLNNRPKSLTSLKVRNDLECSTPYLRTIKVTNPCLVLKKVKNRSKKRIDASFFASQNSPEVILGCEDGFQKSTSCEILNIVSDSDSSDRKNRALGEIFEKLQKALVDVNENEFKVKSKVYISVYNELASSDVLLGKLLLAFKNGLFYGLKKYYKAKISDLKKEVLTQKKFATGLKAEKDTLIGKLNFLSSQNIDLLNSCEDLIKKNAKLEEMVSGDPTGGKNRFALVHELSQKTEKIKELSLKIEEMNCHENKLLQIIHKFNVEGIDVKKLYSKTPVRHGLFEGQKKKKHHVPFIDLTVLDAN